MYAVKDEHVIKKLKKLLQLDIDAVGAYTQAIDAIEDNAVKQTIIEFRADHQHHIENLSKALRDIGEEPPENKPDLKGFLIEGFTAVRSMTGTAGALKAMHTNEKLTNKWYDDAITWDLPAAIKILIQKNRDDEHRHLAYIEKMLETKPWQE